MHAQRPAPGCQPQPRMPPCTSRTRAAASSCSRACTSASAASAARGCGACLALHLVQLMQQALWGREGELRSRECLLRAYQLAPHNCSCAAASRAGHPPAPGPPGPPHAAVPAPPQPGSAWLQHRRPPAPPPAAAAPAPLPWPTGQARVGVRRGTANQPRVRSLNCGAAHRGRLASRALTCCSILEASSSRWASDVSSRAFWVCRRGQSRAAGGREGGTWRGAAAGCRGLPVCLALAAASTAPARPRTPAPRSLSLACTSRRHAAGRGRRASDDCQLRGGGMPLPALPAPCTQPRLCLPAPPPPCRSP